ncbi:MBL fold metallo-hydrolase [Klenkia sp. PcliD-1-E]|uniref:MBL fold metallo-hydrolase n=1 Tax=Klenkia sp. PcliD-1-E TaxID=2954492 RepID=UPI00209834DC|nr:MBL fold metallo-hydrolase [Klenkia sp. PcliD-1-E]MCO7219844.1 MBL fold metallo-hydrolase [Klenkia sp. PcliD-1-E]
MSLPIDPSGPRVITLGTSGGPRWWNGPDGRPRSGIATAVVVGDLVYLVDAGQGAGRQLKNAGIDLARVRAVFLTHLHSDHVVDLPTLLLFAAFERKDPELPAITVRGPGSRGALPPVSDRAQRPVRPVAPERPLPGTRDLVDGLVRAFATDVNDRLFDSLTRGPDEHLDVADIELPADLAFDPDVDVAPPMAPIEVFRDDAVVVTAVLVSHAPTAPAFAFRFDTAEGSVTISGDTAPCDNLVILAAGTDLLMHEAIDLEGIAAQYPGGQLTDATMDHHRRAHTTPREAGEIATRAGARALLLHHLVPVHSPPERWQAARETFAGPLFVPDDLSTVPFGAEATVLAGER